ncbi:MAG: cupin fold metalloprotein, WbuC family [Candidatus Omnitrophica bacterium]|nr:cupin fold metalloprotein, WbuC family [Candidatus Omnitrophota bacterium]
MQDVFKNEENFIAVGKDWMVRLKEAAEQSPKQLSRLCMHCATSDVVQEMILGFTKKCLIPPNSNPGKSESLTVIEGEMLLVLFDDSGKVTQRIAMGPVGGGDKVFMYRLCSSSWHTMIPLTDCVIVHECIEGPFVKSEVPIPSWVPKDKAELESFLKRLTVN